MSNITGVLQALSDPTVAKRRTRIGDLPVNETGIDLLDKACSNQRDELLRLRQELADAKCDLRQARYDLERQQEVSIPEGATVVIYTGTAPKDVVENGQPVALRRVRGCGCGDY